MSDIGVLSQEYQNTAEWFRAINQAVILVKKRFYNLAGAAEVSDRQLGGARQSLARIINELIAKLEAPAGDDTIEYDEEEPTVIPAFLVRQRHQGALN